MKNVFILSVMFLAACGTVFSGSSQTITFDSNIKKEIKIYVDGALVCNNTPCIVDIERRSSPMAIIAKADGYEDCIMQNRAKINSVSWGNLLSVYSWTTDFATSSMWKYSKDGVYINMVPKNKKQAVSEKFEYETKIKHFVLYNYAEIKNRNKEYIKALSELTKRNISDIQNTISNSHTEVELAHNLI